MDESKKKKRLAEIDDEINDRRVFINKLQGQLAKLKEERTALALGANLGDIIEWEDRGKALRGVVRRFWASWPKVLLIKKDGTLGTQERHVYDAKFKVTGQWKDPAP